VGFSVFEAYMHTTHHLRLRLVKLRITDIRTANVCVPLSTFGRFEPVTMWYGTRYAALKTIIFIDTDEGVTGLGECWADASGTIQSLRKFIVGRDPFDVNAIEREINNHGNVRTVLGQFGTRLLNVTGGLSMALWDIIGKACGQPIYKLIGGRYRERVETRYWMCDKHPEDQAEEAVKAVKAGWRAFKIKLGVNPEHDVACVKAVREAVGDRIDIGFDFNGSYPAGKAIWTIRKMERYDPSHIEEPVNSYNIDAMAHVRGHVDVPILCCGRGRSTKESIQELIVKRACDAVNLDLCENGGFLETQRCAAVAEAGGLEASTHSSPGELGIATAAQLHLVTATPSFLEPGDSSYCKVLPPSEDIITKPFRYENGTLTVPEGPGLGVEIDEKKFEEAKRRYETELERWQHIRGRDPRVPARQLYYWFDYPEKYEWEATQWPHRPTSRNSGEADKKPGSG
jgi:L-alanine-DL-glutamate epimerase-like enolase superfamily enzyme